jgi:AcrR family transcriptional regulator
MARSDTPSNVAGRGGARSAGTRRRLIDAAIEALKSEGYAGAGARATAERAGSDQGLIFDHFGSVANLLLAALDSVLRCSATSAATAHRRWPCSPMPGSSRVCSKP